MRPRKEAEWNVNWDVNYIDEGTLIEIWIENVIGFRNIENGMPIEV